MSVACTEGKEALFAKVMLRYRIAQFFRFDSGAETELR
jgi:hypothetical protein